MYIANWLKNFSTSPKCLADLNPKHFETNFCRKLVKTNHILLFASRSYGKLSRSWQLASLLKKIHSAMTSATINTARSKASDKTHLTNFSGDQHAWPLFLTSGNIQKDISRKPKKCAWIHIRLIPWPPKGAKNTDEAWHNVVGTVLSPLRNIDITGPGLKCDWADGFQRQCYPLLAAWVGDYPEQVTVAQVSYGPCPTCEMPNGVLVAHSTIQPLNHWRD